MASHGFTGKTEPLPLLLKHKSQNSSAAAYHAAQLDQDRDRDQDGHGSKRGGGGKGGAGAALGGSSIDASDVSREFSVEGLNDTVVNVSTDLSSSNTNSSTRQAADWRLVRGQSEIINVANPARAGVRTSIDGTSFTTSSVGVGDDSWAAADSAGSAAGAARVGGSLTFTGGDEAGRGKPRKWKGGKRGRQRPSRSQQLRSEAAMMRRR